MTVAVLVLFALACGFVLVALFAEPHLWQTYERLIDDWYSRRDGRVTDAALEAFIADEMLHEASDG